MTKAECRNLFLTIMGEKTVNGSVKGDLDLSASFDEFLYPAMLFVANCHYAEEKTEPVKPINDSDELGMTPAEEQLVPYKVAIECSLARIEYSYKVPALTTMFDTVASALFPQTECKAVYKI